MIYTGELSSDPIDIDKTENDRAFEVSNAVTPKAADLHDFGYDHDTQSNWARARQKKPNTSRPNT